MNRRVLLCVLALACESPMGIEPGGVVFEPPPHYATLWAGLETCSGHRGNFSRVEFVRYATSTIPGTNGWIGRATKSVYRIEFAQQNTSDGNAAHEMLHLLIPESGHPAKYATMCPQVAGWP